MVDDNWVKQPEDENLAALKRLHAALVRHGITDGEGDGDPDAWLESLRELMAAMGQAEAVIDKAK